MTRHIENFCFKGFSTIPMKTRKKFVKSPIKGRRSNNVCFKKSPMLRKNPHQSFRKLYRNNKTAVYDSPLKHLCKTNLNTGNCLLNCNKKNVSNSTLSRINDTIEDNKFSDSIIIIEDTNFSPISKRILSNSKTNKLSNQFDGSSVNTGPLSNSEEIVVIDCNDSFVESATSNNILDGNINLPNSSENLVDSVIIIDPDDELPVQTANTVPKSNEDCFVVWSSLPCTSTNKLNNPSKSHTNDLHNINSRLSENNKIIVDTHPDLRNLNYINNENNEPIKNQTDRNVKAILTRPHAKITSATKSTVIETKSLVTVMSAKKFTKKSQTKNEKKITAPFIKRTKNNGELIFLSEPKEDNEVVTKVKKFKKGKLREIVIDGSNIAMAYTNNKIFSETGIKVLIDYFTKKGHTIKVFVPQYRRSRKFPLLEKWYKEGIVVFTPSRKLGNKSYTPYDDRYILEYATACNGIVVSQDQFRDLYTEKPQYRDTIENRLLVPTFVGEYVMFPEDPLGRDGPTLADFLKHQ
ncbi:PREDICTED: NEDD4-binding protein 1 [Ceratosolen solmsi marchali]|uniref:NEDD4-binding protein 1 n=1 Tax=Ceratosolen solmsi marchali TaxID=326594 RepID=A0AAJ6VIT6_9HYME|nr:PREDICTED: NEDD4-binding protein 1 [Ceratosolen solmsi marchali]